MDLILVRHGESEGNVATKRSKAGDNSIFTEKFKKRHSSSFRLSGLGIKQAKAAHEWIIGEISTEKGFDRYLTSEYVRAMETAALLWIPKAKWYVDFYLRERNWGDMEVLTEDDRRAIFSESMHMKNEDPFHWKPPNGESIADVCLRVDRVLHTLHRETSDKRVIIVCHGEVMWAFRVRMERLSQERYKELDLSENPHDRIHNCQILHYTRRDPHTLKVTPYANWMRSICPTNMTLSSNVWRKIHRPSFTNEELLARAERVRSMVK